MAGFVLGTIICVIHMHEVLKAILPSSSDSDAEAHRPREACSIRGSGRGQSRSGGASSLLLGMGIDLGSEDDSTDDDDLKPPSCSAVGPEIVSAGRGRGRGRRGRGRPHGSSDLRADMAAVRNTLGKSASIGGELTVARANKTKKHAAASEDPNSQLRK